MSKKYLSLLLCLLIGVGMLVGCAQQGATPVDEPALSELTVAVSPGPVSYPVTYMVEQQDENMEKGKINMTNWRTYEQLISMITANQVHIAASPITNAIMLYNKGYDVQLLTVSCWGMLFVVGTEELPNGLDDLKGQEVGVTGQGGIHDLIFRHLLIQKGIDPDQDLNIVYLDLPESSAKLATGDLKFAVLNEPQSSMAIINAKKNSVSLKRIIDLQEVWGVVTETENRIPQAGYILVNGSGAQAKDAMDFYLRYEEACRWVNENPQEAGPIVEKYIEWMKAPAVESSVPFANLQPVKAADCQTEIEAFFNEITKTAPKEALGGKLPDAQFYFQH